MSAEKVEKIFSPAGQPGWTQCENGALTPGVQVMLASGGPMMVVNAMESDSVAICSWATAYRQQSARFAVRALWRKDR